jgi:hypothetical protein
MIVIIIGIYFSSRRPFPLAEQRQIRQIIMEKRNLIIGSNHMENILGIEKELIIVVVIGHLL